MSSENVRMITAQVASGALCLGSTAVLLGPVFGTTSPGVVFLLAGVGLLIGIAGIATNWPRAHSEGVDAPERPAPTGD